MNEILIFHSEQVRADLSFFTYKMSDVDKLHVLQFCNIEIKWKWNKLRHLWVRNQMCYEAAAARELQELGLLQTAEPKGNVK